MASVLLSSSNIYPAFHSFSVLLFADFFYMIRFSFLACIGWSIWIDCAITSGLSLLLRCLILYPSSANLLYSLIWLIILSLFLHRQHLLFFSHIWCLFKYLLIFIQITLSHSHSSYIYIQFLYLMNPPINEALTQHLSPVAFIYSTIWSGQSLVSWFIFHTHIYTLKETQVAAKCIHFR